MRSNSVEPLRFDIDTYARSQYALFGGWHSVGKPCEPELLVSKLEAVFVNTPATKLPGLQHLTLQSIAAGARIMFRGDMDSLWVDIYYQPGTVVDRSHFRCSYEEPVSDRLEYLFRLYDNTPEPASEKRVFMGICD